MIANSYHQGIYPLLYQRIYSFWSGYLCGIVWEFFNYWAAAKWVYHVPYLSQIKIFEMPVLGFLGFGPFGILFVEMYRFLIYAPSKVLNYRQQRQF